MGWLTHTPGYASARVQRQNDDCVAGWTLNAYSWNRKNVQNEYKHTSEPTACVLMIPLHQGWWKNVFKISSASLPEVWRNHNVCLTFDVWMNSHALERFLSCGKDLTEAHLISDSYADLMSTSQREGALNSTAAILSEQSMQASASGSQCHYFAVHTHI